jgi:hypothetical protein
MAHRLTAPLLALALTSCGARVADAVLVNPNGGDDKIAVWREDAPRVQNLGPKTLNSWLQSSDATKRALARSDAACFVAPGTKIVVTEITHPYDPIIAAEKAAGLDTRNEIRGPAIDNIKVLDGPDKDCAGEVDGEQVRPRI